MKKVLLIAGILIIVLCILSLSYAALNMHGYHHIFDGSASLYDRLHKRMIIYFSLGAALAAAGTACIIIQAKM